jgi:glycerate 2-kinase
MSADLKNVAREIFRRTLAAIDLREAMARNLERRGPALHAGVATLDLREFRETVAIAFGKAAFGMAQALGEILLPEYSYDGILVIPAAPPHDLPGWKTFVGGHPVPNEQSFAAGRAILDRLARCDERSLIIFLLSGGGSSLVEQPFDGRATLADFQQLHGALVGCGAPIEEINAVRKHFSAIKGGRLADAAPLSTKLTLAVSDVPPGVETALASGPTVPDPTTLADVSNIIRRYGLLENLPPFLRQTFKSGTLRETPKTGAPAFARSHFVKVLDSHDLTHAAHHACEAAGFQCICDRSTDNWPLEKAADHLLAMLDQQRRSNPGKPVAVIADGEVSSPVTGKGIGGRNSAFVLTCAPMIAGAKIAVLSAGTDGIDGNSPAAGAAANGATLARAQAANIDCGDFLRRSDAHTFFASLDDAIFTGPTGNNLRDLRIFLAEGN